MDTKSKESGKLPSRRRSSFLLRPCWTWPGRRHRPSSNSNPTGQKGTSTTLSIQTSVSSSHQDQLGQGGTSTTSISSVNSHSKTIQRSPSSRSIYRYDVFLSFRGTDTRNSFVDHLYAHLIRKGIFVFKDDQRLQKGESILPQLEQAIQDSRVSIIVFSKTYAESTWCLNEMATIAECNKELKQTVFPVFYDIDPSHVRKQNGVYWEPFVSHTQKFKHDLGKVHRWKTAMTGLAELVGWDVRNKPEIQEIENIIQAVIKTLGHKFSGFVDDLIGMQPRVEALERLLKLNSEEGDYRVIGIWGMGGIGKTTLATVLYDRISYQFDGCCFIENVRKIYKDDGAIAVQKQILRQTIDEINLETYSPFEISGIVRNRLHNLKVLLVLDNIDQLEQLQELAINPQLLHKGSRMIVTTRDKHILKVYGVCVVHEVPLLNYNDAREFFCKKAFKFEEQNSSCVELIPEVLQYAQNLPLTIKVIGSFLCTRDATQWRDALDRLHHNPDNKIMDVLQVSIDELEYQEKEIFLHIACFFKGEREDYVKRILDACGLHPHIGIPRMIDKSLISVRNQEIHMHEMLQELGKKMIRHQCPEKPGLWSRLWLYEDFFRVLMTKSGTDNLEAIVLDQKENASRCNVEGLSKMTSLRLLILYDKNFSGNLDFLSNNLQYLLWHGYPFPSLPLTFEPYYLVELNMSHSSIQQLWQGVKHLPYLKRMDMSNSKYLKEIPSFEGIPNLERLDLTRCTNLLEVHPSIGLLTKLAFLSLRNCSSLVYLKFGNASNLTSLKVLQLWGCTKLENTSLVGASNLEYLDMDRCTSLSTVHESIGNLAKLRFLSLRDCTNLVNIPMSISAMMSVIIIDLSGCLKLQKLPLTQTFNSYCLKSLISMDVSFCNLHEVPDAIGQLWSLERLNLQGNNFVSITSTITRLDRLAYLNLSHCHKLKSLPKLPSVNATSGGRYFKMISGSRDHMSGLYIFDCPKVIDLGPLIRNDRCPYAFQWLQRLVEVPHYFRCGFDIVVPWDWISIPKWFYRRFDGGSIIRIMHSDVDDNWTGSVFCVVFEANNQLTVSGSSHHSFSLPLPNSFYLSFENEQTEERFDMPLSVELDNIDGLQHLWMIYISREHCHFMKTGACITFKAYPGLMMKQWGLRLLTKQDVEALRIGRVDQCDHPVDNLVIDKVTNRSSNFGSKIQLPYNWFVSNEDEVENNEANMKENNLTNLGL